MWPVNVIRKKKHGDSEENEVNEKVDVASLFSEL